MFESNFTQASLAPNYRNIPTRRTQGSFYGRPVFYGGQIGTAIEYHQPTDI